jgi:hypothetical protein
MPRRLGRAASEIPLLDLRSLARSGPDRRVHLTPAVLEQIVRTAARAPEVMVKVSGGANSTGGAIAHLKYIDRQGKLEVETDEGLKAKAKGVEAELVEEWDLEGLRAQARGPYRRTAGRTPAKLVHNVILSMPKGTSPEKLLLASRDFAREEFALKHRYALVLHTDQDHPHVHLVIKAVSEQGERLNIRKATLREWRGLFAQHLRAHGVAANATERAVRGQTRKSMRDGIFRSEQRGVSRYMRDHLFRAATQSRGKSATPDAGKAKLLETREQVIRAWHAVADALLERGQAPLAEKIWKFIGGMPPAMTENEQRMHEFKERVRERTQERVR